MRQSSALSRGDLLRWLQHSAQTPLAQPLTAPLGFELPPGYALIKPIPPIGPQPGPIIIDPAPPVDPNPVPDKPSPERFYVLQSRTLHAVSDDAQSDLPAAISQQTPVEDEELQPWGAGQPLSWQPILPAARMQAFLKHSLSATGGLQLDVPRLVKQVARLQSLQRLPRRHKIRPAGRVVVLVDLSKRLRPFWQDAQQLCQLIVRKHGRTGLQIRLLDDGPQGGFVDEFDTQQRSQPWQRIPNQSKVFIISDLGQLAGADSLICQQWQTLLQQLQRQGINSTVLAPLAASQQVFELQSLCQQVLWRAQGRLRPRRLTAKPVIDHGQPAPPDAHQLLVEQVLALISVTVHVEPELLRALVQLVGGDSGVEAAVWLHEAVHWGYTAISLKAEQRPHYQQQFQQQSAALQQHWLTLLQAQHLGQCPLVWAEELLNAQPLVNFDLAQLADVQPAQKLMQRVARRLNQQPQHSGIAQYARRHLQRLGKDSLQHNLDYASVLYASAHQQAIVDGATIPTVYDAAIIQQLTSQRLPTPRRYQVRQIGEQLQIRESLTEGNNPLRCGVLLAEFDCVRDSLLIGPPNGLQRVALNQHELMLALPDTSLLIDSGREQLEIAAIEKPSWAQRIQQTDQGLQAELDFAGQCFRFDWLNLDYPFDNFSQTAQRPGLVGVAFKGSWSVQNPIANRNKQAGPLVVIEFDQYGLYADLTINEVTQRFRWIAPGTFWMGSPVHELDREKSWNGKEALHAVTLSKGYWLADSACTQALWQAVMGENPSHFKDDTQKPVEQISWLDIQQFLKQANSLLPGLSLRLPSEAEWEYACRAGTQTPFSFGENISTDQVNYCEDNSYSGGENGKYRQTTVPVKSLPANPWGLYEMHGNLWEWCQDAWKNDLGNQPKTDPLNDPKKIGLLFNNFNHVLRGGSWRNFGSYGRSSIRRYYQRDNRNWDIGFRLALG